MTALLTSTETAEATTTGGPAYWLTGPLELPAPYTTPTAAKMQKLLATLLLHAGQVVYVATLIDELWDGKPPRSAVATVQTYVLKSRQLGFANVLETVGRQGYRLNIGRDLIDSLWFEDRIARIMRQEAASQEGLRTLRNILAVPRGPILVSVTCGPVLQPLQVRFEETWLSALTLSFAWALDLGQHREITPVLAELVHRYPFHEGFAGQYMQALYLSGRQKEALDAYRRLRQTVRSELGIEPCPHVRNLHQMILQGGTHS